jgi:hypothetical protein
MSAAISKYGFAPLLGHDLVRLLYLDEGGSDRKAPFLSVAGVMVHGEKEWPEIDRRVLDLIEKHIPENDHIGFVFHATDIFHGSGYFDRRKPEWEDREKRTQILNDLAAVIDDLNLPIVTSNYQKDMFAPSVEEFVGRPGLKGNLMQSIAAMDCLRAADYWLEHHAPSDLAVVTHEDGTEVKPLIKKYVRIMRNKSLMEREGFPPELFGPLGLPLKRIIDTVHFVDKADARALQLADLCAFTIARGLKGLEVPQYATQVIYKHAKWMFKKSTSNGAAAAVPLEGAGG